MEDLIYLCIALKKPISCFFPKHWLLEDEVEKNLTPLEKELLIQGMQLDNDDLRRLIAQARAKVELSEK